MTAQGTAVPLPKSIGKYRIEKVLGRGAMGVVYLARDPTIERPVALKTIHLPEGLDDEKVKEFRARFLREARAAGRLSHPTIVTIYEADDGSAGGPPFIAMEYVEGLPWNYKIKRGTKQDPDGILPLIREIASALDYAHRNGIIHRDIKPANIVQTPDGHVKLMDFGIAKVPTSELTREGQFLGTPAYMSPEQVLGKAVDGRSDLFSLGTVLYELLTCQKPFPGEELTTVSFKICREDPPPVLTVEPALPVEADQIVRHLLQKDPANRYASARELVEDIDAYLGGAALPHAGTAPGTRPSPTDQTLIAPPPPSADAPKPPSAKAAPATPPPAKATPPAAKTRKAISPVWDVGGLVGVFLLLAAVLGTVFMVRQLRGGTPPPAVESEDVTPAPPSASQSVSPDAPSSVEPPAVEPAPAQETAPKPRPPRRQPTLRRSPPPSPARGPPMPESQRPPRHRSPRSPPRSPTASPRRSSRGTSASWWTGAWRPKPPSRGSSPSRTRPTPGPSQCRRGSTRSPSRSGPTSRTSPGRSPSGNPSPPARSARSPSS